MIFKIRKAVLLILILAVATIMGEQALSQTTVGIQPLGSYADGGIDQISLANLGVHIDIPLFQHRGRGSRMGINIHLVYDSSYASSGESPIVDVGWRVVPATAAPGTVVVHQDLREFMPLPCEPGVTRCNAGYTNYTYSFAFIDSTGYAHPFYEASSVKCQGKSPASCTDVDLSPGGAYAYDNSGYYITVNPNNPSPIPGVVTVTTPSGDVFSSILQYGVTDANGNTASTNASEGGYWVDWSQTLTDDTGVSATLTGGAYSSSNYTNWAYRHPLKVQYSDTTGNLQAVVVNYTLTTISYTCPSSGFSFSQLVGLVQSVVYPDGSSYHFTYYSSGALASMQLPTGGTINYTGNLGLAASCGLGLPASQTRSTLDGNTTYTQTVNSTQLDGNYQYTTTTTISHPDSGSEIIHFVDVVMLDNVIAQNTYTYETAHTWYSASGALLKSTMRCYNGATGDCTTTPVTLPITQIATTTILDNGLTSRNVEYLNPAGLVTEVDEYDFGASTPSRKAVTAYAALGNNINNRPSSVTIYGSGGNTAVRL